MINKTVLQIALWTLGFLFTGNIFFIKRLVDQQDKANDVVWQLRQEFVVLKYAIDHKANCKDGG